MWHSEWSWLSHHAESIQTDIQVCISMPQKFHQCFIWMSIVYSTDLQDNLSATLNNWASTSMRQYHSTIASLWLCIQAQYTNKDKSKQAATRWERQKDILTGYGDREAERERKIWLRLFIAHERKQRQISEPNRKTHLKNSVKRIRSITSELSIMEANKLTGN